MSKLEKISGEYHKVVEILNIKKGEVYFRQRLDQIDDLQIYIKLAGESRADMVQVFDEYTASGSFQGRELNFLPLNYDFSRVHINGRVIPHQNKDGSVFYTVLTYNGGITYFGKNDSAVSTLPKIVNYPEI